ncbi:MAG TPA: hypothetical protein VKB76_12935 [Ktedonobacterales bacterium]|nr:hypothetical protein [Ktedonobacterales bacterium]
MYQWLVFLHILGVFGFLLAHGAATAVSFSLRNEREIPRIRAWLDLSRSAESVANISLLVLLAAGIAAGIMGNWWGHLWIWTALGLLVLMSVSMFVLGSRPFNQLRMLVQRSESMREKQEGVLAMNKFAEEQLAPLLKATHPLSLTVIGGGGLALILWLMLFKPF